ncbi:MAG: TonB-dependent receptor [Gemmatimonadaceae bacterium]
MIASSWLYRARQLMALVLLFLCASVPARAEVPNGDLHGAVTDSASGNPIPSAQVSVTRDGRIIQNTLTNDFGQFVVHNLGAGSYAVSVHFIGFKPFSGTVTVAGADVRLNVRLEVATTHLQAVQVTAEAPVAVDTRTGDQVFTEQESHVAPTTTTSQIVQQSVAGAVRAPTGEVHIRGQHAEYTYYVDGIPVASGVSGSLNELFDPAIINRLDFQTGGWDAEYGEKNAAIINVATRIPTGAFHMNASAAGGSFGAYSQSLNMSGNSGKWGFFVSGSRAVTDMRLDPVSFDTVSFAPRNFHNHGEDDFGFAKIQYQPGNSDIVTLDMDWGRTYFQVPYDTTGGVGADDHQQDVNGFANFGWRHHFGGSATTSSAGSELFAGAFYRHGSLDYTPGDNDTPQFFFAPDTTTAYNLLEHRYFDTFGAKVDYSYKPSNEFEWKSGVLASQTSGHENFVTTSGTGTFGPASNSGLAGGDFSLYSEVNWSLSEHFELRTGARYDTHAAPFAGTVSQFSPRIRLNFYPDNANTFFVYFGRLFIPTNVEDLRNITSVADAGVATVPTVPERDAFYEAGYLHRFGGGVVVKLDGYHKSSSPGIDDNTIPGSAIVTDVNLQYVSNTGVELVTEYHPDGPFSGYVNVALDHAYSYGAVYGGFFESSPPAGDFDLDHDQRLSIVASGTYSAGKFYATATEVYGSGLTNGADPGADYGTGLFSFNSAIKVAPNYITNVALGYTLNVGATTVRPELFIDNLFDSRYLLKGAFFSGASVGRPRSVSLRVNLGV